MGTPLQRRQASLLRQRESPISGRPLNDADLLDEHEQLELIEQMERAASRQRHYSKSLLTLLGTAVALIYLFFACKQLLAPFSTPHQARLAGHLRPHAVAVADFGGAAAAMLAVAAVLCYIPGGHQAGANWRTLLALAALVSGLEAAFWSVAMWRVAQDTAAALWRLAWLPVVPPCFTLLIAAAISVMQSTRSGVEALRRARYPYKRA